MLCCRGIFFIWTFSLFVLAVLSKEKSWNELKKSHKLRNLTDQRMIRVATDHGMENFIEVLRNHILKERIPGTPGIEKVRRYIVNDLRNLSWDVKEDEFFEEAPAPYGLRKFVNIIATQNPNARRWLTLACHYDSKIIQNRVFLAATDSAVPCTMMLHLAHKLNAKLQSQPDKDISLQLLFLDGEEAFVRWTDTDSVYGARHLAAMWQNTPFPTDNIEGTTTLDRIDVFVLLDLLGAENPIFRNWYPATSKLYSRLADIELKLQKIQRNQIKIDQNVPDIYNTYSRDYFTKYLYHQQPYIEDDHIPFYIRGVPVLHLISAPFPRQWHTVEDDYSNLHMPTIRNLNAILRIFVTEYLHLDTS